MSRQTGEYDTLGKVSDTEFYRKLGTSGACFCPKCRFKVNPDNPHADWWGAIKRPLRLSVFLRTLNSSEFIGGTNCFTHEEIRHYAESGVLFQVYQSRGGFVLKPINFLLVRFLRDFNERFPEYERLLPLIVKFLYLNLEDMQHAFCQLLPIEKLITQISPPEEVWSMVPERAQELHDSEEGFLFAHKARAIYDQIEPFRSDYEVEEMVDMISYRELALVHDLRMQFNFFSDEMTRLIAGYSPQVDIQCDDTHNNLRRYNTPINFQNPEEQITCLPYYVTPSFAIFVPQGHIEVVIRQPQNITTKNFQSTLRSIYGQYRTVLVDKRAAWGSKSGRREQLKRRNDFLKKRYRELRLSSTAGAGGILEKILDESGHHEITVETAKRIIYSKHKS